MKIIFILSLFLILNHYDDPKILLDELMLDRLTNISQS